MEGIMHNLISFNNLEFTHQSESKLKDKQNEVIDDYFQCIIECDEEQQVCKRICKEVLLT